MLPELEELCTSVAIVDRGQVLAQGRVSDIERRLRFGAVLRVRLLADGELDPARYKDVLMHRIDGGEILEGFHASTKSATDAKLIHTLRDLGRNCAAQWLQRHSPSLGVKSTINIHRDYLDDLRVPSR